MTNRTKILIGIVIVILIIVIIFGFSKNKKIDNNEVQNQQEFGNVFDYINETMRQVDEEILLPGDDYVPKFYERTRAENNTRRRNNRRNNTDGNESGHNA